MLQQTCQRRNSSTSIVDVDEKLSPLLSRINSCVQSTDIVSVAKPRNLTTKVTEVMSESSIKTNASPSETKIFSAPPGVIPYHVKWSRIRKKSGGQRLIFVWPQKNVSRASYLSSLVPLVRRMLVGLVYLGAIHIWPGEFLPTSIPLTAPLPNPLPVKSTIIEPLWEDDDNPSIY